MSGQDLGHTHKKVQQRHTQVKASHRTMIYFYFINRGQRIYESYFHWPGEVKEQTGEFYALITIAKHLQTIGSSEAWLFNEEDPWQYFKILVGKALRAAVRQQVTPRQPENTKIRQYFNPVFFSMPHTSLSVSLSAYSLLILIWKERYSRYRTKSLATITAIFTVVGQPLPVSWPPIP